MQVNFNNVRKTAIKNYEDLVKILNKSLCTDVDYTRVVVPVQDIQRPLDRLRDALVTIGCTYDDKTPDFSCIIDENTEIAQFNPEEE